MDNGPIFSVDSQAEIKRLPDPATDALANLRNGVASLVFLVLAVLLAVSPALVIYVWRWAL